MTEHLLTQWEAIELFCKIISKYKGIDLRDFRDNGELTYWLGECDKDFSTTFSEVCLQPLAAKAKKERAAPSGLYDLCQDIQYERPVKYSSNRLGLFLEYIGEEKKIGHYKQTSLWQPSNKQRMFEDTIWALYYYEEYTNPKTGDLHPGITRAIVKFHTFSKVSINNIDASKGLPGDEEAYNGNYSIYGGEGRYLLIDGRLGDAKERDLHILVYIGTGAFKIGDIAIGQYHNISGNIYSGTVVMENLAPEADARHQFFENNISEIDEVLWNYFRDKGQNRIKAKSGITRKQALQDWIDTKQMDVAKPSLFKRLCSVFER